MRFLIAILLAVMSQASHASEVQFEGVVLLQPDFVLQERGLEVSEFAGFIKSVQDAAVNTWKPSKLPAGSGFIVVAVREGGKVNAWLDFKPEVPAPEEARVLDAIRALAPFKVKKGTVLFALDVSLDGAKNAKGALPNPKAWRAAAKGRPGPTEAEQLVDLVWPRQTKQKQ